MTSLSGIGWIDMANIDTTAAAISPVGAKVYGQNSAGVAGWIDSDQVARGVNIKSFGAVGDGVADDLQAFLDAKTAAGATGIIYLQGPATYFFDGVRPDLSGVNIYADPDVTIKADANPNTKELQLLTPVTINNTVHGTTLVGAANTKIQVPEMFNVAPGLLDMALTEVSTLADFTTWSNKVYQVASGDITSANMNGTVAATQITWGTDFAANPQVSYPEIVDGALFEINAASLLSTICRIGVFTKTSDRVWIAEVAQGSASLYFTEYNLSGAVISSGSFTLPNGGAYGWPALEEVNIGFVVNGTITTMILNGLPVYKFPAGSTAAGFYYGTADDFRQVVVKDPIKTTSYKIRVKQPLNVGVIGDSISYGAWNSLDITELLPSFIQNLPHIGDTTVINHAISGASSAYWATGDGAAVDLSAHDIVLCMIGSNDIQSSVLPATYITNLATIGTNIVADGAAPIFGIFPVFTSVVQSGVTGVTTTNYSKHAKYTHALKKFCIQNGYGFADMRRNFGTNLAWYGDNVHPTLEGQIPIMTAWAEAIQKYLQGKSGFLLA